MTLEDDFAFSGAEVALVSDAAFGGGETAGEEVVPLLCDIAPGGGETFDADVTEEDVADLFNEGSDSFAFFFCVAVAGDELLPVSSN